jgi:radical SAM superfamily enzyme YgiQ (UPF0313 family)
MKTALIFPPQWFPSQPYLALPTLTAFLQHHGHAVDQFDFNIESYDTFLSRDYLEECLKKITGRLNRPAYTPEENEVKGVYREILGDTDFLESVLNGVEDAKNAMRTEEMFFQFPVYKQAYTTLKVAMQLISYAHYPTKIDLESYFMQGNPEENMEGILQATTDPVTNPYLTLFENRMLSKVPWDEYGLVGISIIHVGQVIAGLTLARLLREKYPHLHICIGGSVFTRHSGIMENKQVLFEKIFHSIIQFEGEHPLLKLVEQLKSGGSLSEVPNLTHLDRGKVITNAKSESLPYDQLVRPTFDQLPLEKYLMPYPVLPYMASRGCYWGKCTFCTHSHIYDSYYRKDNEERVALDLDYLGKRYGTRYFTFSDEAISPNAFKRMSYSVLKHKVDMRALGMIKFEADTVESEDLFKNMFDAGFIMLFFGLESANDRILSIIDKGCDQKTEKMVLENSSRAGIWNHLYLFFGFPTEEREEAEDTIQFTIDHGERGTGSVHSVGQSTFTLEKDSAIYHNPQKFSIDRILRDPDRDMAIIFDYEIQKGMPRDEIMEVYQRFDGVLEEQFPSRKIWNYLSREHFLLYLDRFGREELLKMAQDDTVTETVGA